MTNMLHELSDIELDSVAGGLKWEGHPQSSNVEDRRTGGWTEAMSISSTGDFARWDRQFGPAVSGGGGCRFSIFSVCLF